MSAVSRTYLIEALRSTPLVIRHLLGPLEVTDSRWDFCPDPTRWTLREMTAHLADCEGFYLQRFRLMRDGEKPHFEFMDTESMARDHDYAHSDPYLNLEIFSVARAETVSVLSSLSLEDWKRLGERSAVPISLEEQALFLVGHDGYHLGQTVEWLEAARAVEGEV